MSFVLQHFDLAIAAHLAWLWEVLVALVDVQVSGAHLQIEQALQERLKYACNHCWG